MCWDFSCLLACLSLSLSLSVYLCFCLCVLACLSVCLRWYGRTDGRADRSVAGLVSSHIDHGARCPRTSRQRERERMTETERDRERERETDRQQTFRLVVCVHRCLSLCSFFCYSVFKEVFVFIFCSTLPLGPHQGP